MPLLMLFALICVLGSGSVIPMDVETLDRPDSVALHTSYDGDLSIFSHHEFSKEMDLQAITVGPTTFTSSLELTSKTLVMATQLTISNVATTAFTDADESAMIYAIAQSTNITESALHEVDLTAVTFVEHTTGFYNASGIVVYTYLPTKTYGPGYELIDLYTYTKTYFEENILNGMFKILLAEGGVTFDTSSFTAVKTCTVADAGYEFQYPSGYFDKGELLSKGDKAAIVIMSIIGFGLALFALYSLINVFRDNREAIATSLGKEPAKSNANGDLEHEKIYTKRGSIFAFSLN